MSAQSTPPVPALPAGTNTVNSFIFTEDTAAFVDFLVEVFGAVPLPDAYTLDTDGLVLHAEVLIGDSTLMLADRKPGWMFAPAFTRVYVDDVPAVLARAEARGGRIVTAPTDFFGDVFSRFADPFGNLWWVYTHNPGAAAWGSEEGAEDADWGAGDSGDAADADASWESFTTPELEYIHSTLIEAMGALRDPREG